MGLVALLQGCATGRPAPTGAGSAGSGVPAAGAGQAEASRTGTPPSGVGARPLDTPIEQLCAVPADKGVIDRDLPGLTTRPEYPAFKSLSLNALATLSGGKISQAKLNQVAADLAKATPSPAAR